VKNPAAKIASARFRAEACARIRSFFSRHNVLEVETPLLSQGASHDCHIDLFSVPKAEAGETMRFLQTSPEPHMKRLLARGYPDIFQIGKAFRFGERGRLHNPEFTLLEWYRLGYSLRQMMEEAAEICRLVAGPRPTVFQSYSGVFVAATGLDPLAVPLEALTAHPMVAERGLTPGHFPDRGDILNFLMSEVAEPSLDPAVLTGVYAFPAELSSQALPDPDHPGTVLRFELFGGGMELGNGYQEIRDSEEYRRRFETENRRRGAQGKTVPLLDENFFRDLRNGLPPCSGTAVGLDRLLLWASGDSSVDTALEFPWEIA
jgi:lysyl-tRNA synthetase class 2